MQWLRWRRYPVRRMACRLSDRGGCAILLYVASGLSFVVVKQSFGHGDNVQRTKCREVASPSDVRLGSSSVRTFSGWGFLRHCILSPHVFGAGLWFWPSCWLSLVRQVSGCCWHLCFIVRLLVDGAIKFFLRARPRLLTLPSLWVPPLKGHRMVAREDRMC